MSLVRHFQNKIANKYLFYGQMTFNDFCEKTHSNIHIKFQWKHYVDKILLITVIKSS